jgi:phosphoserine aminotransferase
MVEKETRWCAAVEKLKPSSNFTFTLKLINPLFKGAAAVEDRSNMNATFLLNNLIATFDAMWKSWNLWFYSVGGYRASMYNAMPIESSSIGRCNASIRKKQFKD